MSTTAATAISAIRNSSDAQACFPVGLAHRILNFIAAP